MISVLFNLTTTESKTHFLECTNFPISNTKSLIADFPILSKAHWAPNISGCPGCLLLIQLLCFWKTMLKLKICEMIFLPFFPPYNFIYDFSWGGRILWNIIKSVSFIILIFPSFLVRTICIHFILLYSPHWEN